MTSVKLQALAYDILPSFGGSFPRKAMLGVWTSICVYREWCLEERGEHLAVPCTWNTNGLLGIRRVCGRKFGLAPETFLLLLLLFFVVYVSAVMYGIKVAVTVLGGGECS